MTVRAAVLPGPRRLEARGAPAAGHRRGRRAAPDGGLRPLEQAEDAIALAGHLPGLNPIHLAIVPGAPRGLLDR
jgi:hypothetical protein